MLCQTILEKYLRKYKRKTPIGTNKNMSDVAECRHIDVITFPLLFFAYPRLHHCKFYMNIFSLRRIPRRGRQAAEAKPLEASLI